MLLLLSVLLIFTIYRRNRPLPSTTLCYDPTFKDTESVARMTSDERIKLNRSMYADAMLSNSTSKWDY